MMTAFNMNPMIKHNLLKRLFDIAFSLTVMIVGAPVFVLIAIAIKCSSKGNVFYAQERIGRGGKPFSCYKFRTMYADADERLEAILHNDPQAHHEWTHFRKLKNDPRVTRIGTFLRKSSLDELPQFWNVMIGDLSVVGPRPVIRSEIEKYFGSKAEKILSIRPGLTGLWQVSGRNNISYYRRIYLDETYVDCQSLYLDLKLILQTIPQMFFPKGAY